MIMTRTGTRTGTLLALAAAGAVLLSLAPAEAASGRLRVRGEQGVVAGGAANGNAWVRGRTHRQNADGSRTAASGGAIRLGNGATAARAATTTVQPDGSAAHSGGFAASGAKGTVTSSGSATRAADGTMAGSRQTSVTAANGNSYQGTVAYDPATGLARSGGCRDASGAAIACPSR
ncbi:hypothetical protein [Mongoliimonas terrestris]|uniref:hypothetical protein n=1 Tax=Mongoliimonas terrestris TaxID=1709001 RepID=UPI0009FAB051|nr:hypothetical protein [Mongoliimonas terrestris]